MTRVLFRLSLPILAILMGVGTLVYIRPYDPGDLRELLLSENCMTPCFIGIQPGVTPLKTALQMLDEHEWIKQVSVHLDADFGAIVIWSWSGAQPALFDGQRNGRLSVAFNSIEGTQTIRSIQLPTSLPLGYASLLLGDRLETDSGAIGGPRVAYVGAAYPEQAALIWTIAPCPLARWQIWNAPMTIDLRQQLDNSLDGLQHIADVCPR